LLLGYTSLLCESCNVRTVREAENEDQDQDIELMIRSGAYKLIDTRNNVSLEVNGYFPGSERMNFVEILASDPDITEDEKVIFILDESTPAFAKKLCVKKASCYIGSMENFSDLLEYPKAVTFQSLSKLLNEKRILFIDVRNATELQDPGQIPGSVHLPLYEIPDAFLLPDNDFKEKYNFEKPSVSERNVVLTCRSGRRIQVADARLKALGYKHLRLYYGSFKDWVKNGGEVFRKSQLE